MPSGNSTHQREIRRRATFPSSAFDHITFDFRSGLKNLQCHGQVRFIRRARAYSHRVEKHPTTENELTQCGHAVRTVDVRGAEDKENSNRCSQHIVSSK